MYLTVSMRLTILVVNSRSTVERFHRIRLTEIEGEILRAASGDVAYQEFRSHFPSSSCTQFCPKLPGLAHATTCFATRRDDSTLSSASSRFLLLGLYPIYKNSLGRSAPTRSALFLPLEFCSSFLHSRSLFAGRIATSGALVRTSNQANCARYREGVNSKYLRNPFSRTFPM
jgi:hypothetical protein